MNEHKRQFIKDCARYIRGEINEVKLTGPKQTVKLFAKTLKESRMLFIALQSESKMGVVIPLLESKKKAAALLRAKTGFVWPF
tara:strand:- start:43 stop:291 length:249 start_codon:yes stop_codon:yes gene_type:complete